MLEAGELEGEKTPQGRWRIPQRAVHELLPTRTPRNRGAGSHQEATGAAERSAELVERVEALALELGRAQGRLELTEQAESTLREQLQRERERADRLEAELRANRESRKSWWQRWVSG